MSLKNEISARPISYRVLLQYLAQLSLPIAGAPPPAITQPTAAIGPTRRCAVDRVPTSILGTASTQRFADTQNVIERKDMFVRGAPATADQATGKFPAT